MKTQYFLLNSYLFSLLLMAVLTFGAWEKAQAGVFSDTQCKIFKAQKKALDLLGVKPHLHKSVDWIEQNLKEAEIYLVKSYILINEKLRFRCVVPETAEKKETDTPQKKRGGQ